MVDMEHVGSKKQRLDFLTKQDCVDTYTGNRFDTQGW